MALMVPPKNPRPVTFSDDDGLNRMFYKLRLLFIALVTILLTIWCCTLGVVPGVLAAMIAKHILVALLVAGLGVDKDSRSETEVG